MLIENPRYGSRASPLGGEYPFSQQSCGEMHSLDGYHLPKAAQISINCDI